MKYAIALTFFLISNLSAYERFPAAYWWDENGNTFVEIENHIFEITPENHSIECPCDWAKGIGRAYIDSVKAALY